MYKWIVCDSVDESYKTSWELLVSNLIPNSHSERKNSFILSREALRLVLIERGLFSDPNTLTLKKFSSLEIFPDLTLSLSHTKTWGGAVLGDLAEYVSLGIDIEEDSRVVKDGVIEKISHPRDENLRKIEIWVLKEAAFKCLMNSGKFEKDVLFRDIQISATGWAHSPSGLKGHLELKQSGKLLVGLASLKN